MAPERNQENFHGAINTTINEGTFTTIGRDMHIHSSSSKRSNGLEILIANTAQGAFHNSAERSDPPRCHPTTRFAVLEEIMTWISAPTARRESIIWLYGPAGTGKTAIAQTIAERCEQGGLLAASFFFGRTVTERNSLSRFVATIAYQLSLSIPETCEPIIAAIEKDPAILSRTLLVQMQTLLVAPLASCPGPRLVVVDGVDEIASRPNRNAQTELLSVLGTTLSELRHIPIVFLIGSRPEYQIRLAFNMNPLRSLMKSLVLDDKYKPDADIEFYLNSEFQEIRKKQLALGTPLPSSWPMKHDVDRLVKKSSGQFIFTSTVVKFVDSRHDPAKCLNIILDPSDPGKETPYAELDALYHLILSSVEDRQKVLEVLTLIMLAEYYNLRVSLAEDLLGFDVRRVLVDMHALVFVPPFTDPEAALRIHHTSLYDFLMDRSRSQDFFVDATYGHVMIGQRWLRMLANYSHSRQCSLSLQLKAFVHYCKRLGGGELADCLASIDLRAVSDKLGGGENLYRPRRHTFITACAAEQEKKPLDSFILDRLLQYPPSIQACIPALFHICATYSANAGGVPNIFLILIYGACQSEAEFAQIQELDARLLDIINLGNDYFQDFFEKRMKSGQNYSNYAAVLAKEIVTVIRPKPGDAKLHVAVEDVEVLLYDSSHDTNIGEFAPPTPSLAFSRLLAAASTNSDLACFLRERALQYRYSERLDKRRKSFALTCLKYIQKCGIPYLEHTHPPDTDTCIVCEDDTCGDEPSNSRSDISAALIIGETWRSSRNQSKRRDDVDEQLAALGTRIGELSARVDSLARKWESDRDKERLRTDQLEKIIERVVDIGTKGGTPPLRLPPRAQLGASDVHGSASGLTDTATGTASSSTSPLSTERES